MLPKHPLHFPYLIFPKKNVQAAAVAPVHEDRRYVIHSRYRAPCTHRRRVRVVHTHQFHPCPDWVLFPQGFGFIPHALLRSGKHCFPEGFSGESS